MIAFGLRYWNIECKRPSCQAMRVFFVSSSTQRTTLNWNLLLLLPLGLFDCAQMLSFRICTDCVCLCAKWIPFKRMLQLMTLYCASNQLHCPFMCRGFLFFCIPLRRFACRVGLMKVSWPFHVNAVNECENLNSLALVATCIAIHLKIYSPLIGYG